MDADFLLIHKMKNGDEEAIEVFVKKYYSTIRNYCRLHTYTDCDAEDITQATFEHFFRSFRSYHHLGKTANYLYVIARNLCRDSYKKKRDIVMEALPDKGENPIAVIENKIDIEESIKKLPEDLQEVVILHYFQDLKLKEVADDIQSRLAEVSEAAGPEYDLKGAFTSAGMDSSSDWRFKTHLANLPIYFEYQADGIGTTKEIKGTYLDNYRDIWNLYINNSTCDPAELAAKTGDDSRNEFLAGDAVFFQNGSWEYGNLTADGTFTDDDLAMIPIYIGVGDEANQGLCTGTENYWCVNKDADEADIQATLDFMDWCVTSDEGTKCMADDMGFNIPFKKAQESKNLFIKEDKQMTEDGKTPVAWNFSTMPSEEWKNGVGSALTAYAADQTDANWDAVVSAFVDGWASEYKLANE